MQLQSAPIVSAVPSESLPWEAEGPSYSPMAVGQTAYYSHVDLSGVNYPQVIMQSQIAGSHQWSFFGAGGGFYIRDRTMGNNVVSVKDHAPANTLVVHQAGRIGIGTTTPNEQLEITGNFRLPTTTAATGIIYAGSIPFIHNYGDDNTFLGEDAGNFTMTGEYNTGVGYYALRENTDGIRNTALGTYALDSNETGDDNTAVGFDVLCDNETGWGNTAVGNIALVESTGDTNTALGCEALYDLDSGSSNLALGYHAGGNLTSGSDNVYISNGGPASESNTTRIGDANQTRTFISGIYGVAIASGAQVVIDANGQLGNAGVSSRKFKRDIADIGSSSQFLYDLRPVSFFYRDDLDPVGVPQFGLVAEEVAEVAPELIILDKEGKPYMVRYELLAPLLLNEVQKQQIMIAEQQSQIEQLLSRLTAVEKEIGALR
ncbi:tail fiber domain-containing protein [Candidatus Bipolaricaulota bacterium]